MADVDYYRTLLLMDMEGVNNGSVFMDYSIIRRSWTVVGAKTSNTAYKYGSTSMYLDGSSWIETPASGESLLGAGDFTIEFWLKTSSSNANILEAYIANKGWSISTQSSCIAFYSGITESRPIVTTGVYVDDNAWHHIALCRAGSILRCFVDGVLAQSATDTANYNAAGAKFGIGAFVNRNLPAYNLTGYIDDLRIVVGVALYTANFTPPGPLDVSQLPIVPSAISDALALVQIGSPSPTSRSFEGPIGIRDDIFGGNGRVSGTTKIKGTPNYAVRRRVRLIRERDNMHIREQWSDQVTGAYSFDNIDSQYKYTVLAYDHEHNFRAVLADNITPEIIT